MPADSGGGRSTGLSIRADSGEQSPRNLVDILRLPLQKVTAALEKVKAAFDDFEEVWNEEQD